MLKRLTIVVLLCLITSLTVLAEVGFDDLGNPNDPNVNERANACFEGGSMAGRCENELHWTAGWYLIRFEYGIFSRDEVHSLVAWVLPPESQDAPPGSSVKRCALAWNPNYYVDFSGSDFVNSGNYWSDPDCTINNGNLGRNWVFSPSGQANATSICVANLGVNYVAIPSHGPVVFECAL
jgi:hypothetical protein